MTGALTFRGPEDIAAFGRLLQELEAGQVGSVAFAVHHHVGWPLPLYELALLSAARLESLGARDIKWKLVTPEKEPLEVFGARASRTVADLLDERDVEVMTSCLPRIARRGHLLLEDGRELRAERVVALPELRVPHHRAVSKQTDRAGADPLAGSPARPPPAPLERLGGGRRGRRAQSTCGRNRRARSGRARSLAAGRCG